MTNFKHQKDIERFNDLFDLLKDISNDAAKWCEAKGLKYTLTATWTTTDEDRLDNRIYPSHREFRAIDVSVLHWSSKDITEFKKYLTEKFGHHGAISSKSGLRNLVVYHNSGSGFHFHIQIDRKYFLEKLARA